MKKKKKARQGMSPGAPKRVPKVIWVLFDLDNGHWPHKQYIWWFPTRRAALDYLREHREVPTNAWLSGPYKYLAPPERT
jgi:hypothetical protein